MKKIHFYSSLIITLFLGIIIFFIKKNNISLFSSNSFLTNFQNFSQLKIILIHFIAFFSLIYLIFSFFDYLKTLSQKKIIYQAFSKYVNIAQYFLKNPTHIKLGGENKYVTVYFLDIKNFSKILKDYESHIVDYLNEYFSAMSAIIFKNQGIVDKYDGDAIMAFWGTPEKQKNQALLACETALEQQKSLKQLRKKWKKENKPEIYADISIVTGNMMVGNIGSKNYLNYTLIGENVNIGFELEKINTIYKTEILVGENTYKEAKSEYVFREIDEIQIKDFNKTKIFELLDKKENIEAKQKELIENYTQALKSYRAKKYEEAKKFVNNCLRIYPNDTPSILLKEKILKEK